MGITAWVEGVLEHLYQDKQSKEQAKRFTVRLDGFHVAMLDRVASALEMTKTGCAEELLRQAILEAWVAVGKPDVQSDNETAPD